MTQIMSMKINSCNSEEPTLTSLLKRQHRTVVHTVYNTVFVCFAHNKSISHTKRKTKPFDLVFLVGGGAIRVIAKSGTCAKKHFAPPP